MKWPALRSRLETPVDVASLVAFRVLFGSLLAIAVARFWAKGFIHDDFVVPKYFFPYPGLEWLRPLPGAWMNGVYAAMFVFAVTFAAGLFYRASAACLCLLFTYAHLADASNYLNHYYLVSLLLLISTFLPLHANGSVDARRRPEIRRDAVPTWVLWLVRFQLGVVYFFGGVAKLGADWLLRAMPLKIWLAAAGDFPIIGGLLRIPETAYVMSWAGAAFDLSTPFLLLCRRTRPFAYALVIVFHLTTLRLFQIGMFPWIMIACTLVFFDPSWPRRLLRLRAPGAEVSQTSGASLGVAKRCLLGAYVALQLLLPLRSWAYPGNVLWTERGYRFSWRVMLMEKTGSAELTVRDPVTGASRQARLRDELTPFQVKMMSTQPDMIAAYARHIADTAELRGEARPQVFADVVVVLNGRAPARLVDAELDLASRAPPARAEWILPMTDGDALASPNRPSRSRIAVNAK